MTEGEIEIVFSTLAPSLFGWRPSSLKLSVAPENIEVVDEVDSFCTAGSL